jgi:hypothetical protein
MTQEWKHKGVCDDVYYVMVHNPCGAEVMILMGRIAACPKCQPEEWERLRAGA